MKRLILFSTLVGFAISAVAQTRLSLEECIELAKTNNKRIEAANYSLSAGEYEQKSAKALFFPNLTLTGNAIYTTANGSYDSGAGQLPIVEGGAISPDKYALFPGLKLSYDVDWLASAGVKIEQPIYMGGKIQTGYRMSKLANNIYRQNKRLTESEIVVATSKAYANMVKAGELLKVANSYNSLLTELLRTVESAYRHGVKQKNDVLKVKVKLNESELNMRKAENALRLAKMNLCHEIGRPIDDDIETTTDLPDVSPEKDAQHDIFERPEYLIVESQSDLAKENIALAKSDYMPQVGLVGQYGYANGIKLNGSKLIDNWNFLVGVQVSIPLYDFGHRTNKIKSAKAQYAKALADRQYTDEMLSLEVAQSYNNLDEAFLEKQLAASTVESANENLRTSRLQYEKGTETLSDYLEAQTIWQQAQQTEIEARINCYVKWLEYRKSVGKIN